MNDKREQYEYEIADGKVYIQILMAERKAYGGGWNGEKATEEIQGRVQLSTDPEFKADTDLGFVKIRGRKYAIEHVTKRLPDNEGRLDRHGITMRWQNESSYRGGYRNDRGSQVSYEAKAYGTLRDIEHEALELFEKDHPDWVIESTRLLFQYEVNHHRDKATRLRQEAHENEGKANDWQKRIDALAAA